MHPSLMKLFNSFSCLQPVWPSASVFSSQLVLDWEFPFTECSPNCKNGTCDYSSGDCTCMEGYFGVNCSESKFEIITSYSITIFISILLLCNFVQLSQIRVLKAVLIVLFNQKYTWYIKWAIHILWFQKKSNYWQKQWNCVISEDNDLESSDII